MLFDEIQSKIWGLSVSAGTAPYTFVHFKIDEELKNLVNVNYLTAYTQGIAFFLWEDYTVNNYRDYIKFSKEYLLINDEQQRERFIDHQIAKNAVRNDFFVQWQHSQMYIALGFTLNEIRKTAVNYKEVEYDNILPLKQLLKVKNGILKEVILF